MPSRLITAPATEPVSTADVKAHLRVDLSDDDTLIEAQVKAARAYVEERTGRALITQTWQLWLDDWPMGDTIRLPRPRLQSVSSILYYGTDGTTNSFASDNYIVDAISEPGRIVLAHGKSWPSEQLRPAQAVVIEYVAGYGDAASDVPADLVSYTKLLVGAMYANREKEVTGTVAARLQYAEALIHPHTILF